MPVMLRAKGKAKKIAYKILGKPANMQNKAKNNKIRDRLLSEATRLIR